MSRLPGSRIKSQTSTIHNHDRRRSDRGIWETLDRVQVLGDDEEDVGRTGYGHMGCVNALSWSDDGSTLLSGSDDRRICIWQPDPDPSTSASSSPHPLKLQETISTGHRANIFSSKFLPNANTPTIVSCAGDREVRVFQVERLGRESTGRGRELNGHSGDGVTILRCHKDRTKKIATENSPSLFLSVSEDGTVRQHDLRRPHICQSECPDPLFCAPRGVDLYSLSISTVSPHLFAVAGRTDCAFICDRRMLERQTPSWGSHTRSSGQVHCVRRLGLPDEEWEKVAPRRADSMFGDERHVSCVKMSSEHADEVIVAFAKHSTSLFSIYDSPGPSNIRSKAPMIVPPNKDQEEAAGRPKDRSGVSRARLVLPEPQNSAMAEEVAPDTDRPGSSERKRRHSDLSTTTPAAGRAPDRTRQRTSDSPSYSDPGDDRLDRVASHQDEDVDMEESESQADLAQSDRRVADVIRLSDYEGIAEDIEAMRGEGSDLQNLLGEEDVEIGPPSPPLTRRDFLRDDVDLDPDCLDSAEVGNQDHELALENEDEDEDDLDAMDFDDDELDDFYDQDEDDVENDDEEDDYIAPTGINASRIASDAFDDVEKILPRRSFKGARNVETVKDCNFLGIRSDKVCSGSDDGNFFVWDKDTGRLEGIWEGDGSIVNVMEQHPSLPLIAVSGIDSTVKMFAPTAPLAPAKSYRRTHLSETIIRRNTLQPQFHTGGAFERSALIQFLASRGIHAGFVGGGAAGGEEGGDVGGVSECATQ